MRRAGVARLPAARTCVAALACSLLLSACDTDDELKAQRLDGLRREYAMLEGVQTFLEDRARSPNKDEIRIFVSRKVIDDVLSGLEGTAIPLPNADGTILTIRRITSEFRVGFPGVSVDALAERSGLKAAVSIQARLDAAIDPARPEELGLKIHIDSLVPVVSWSIFNLQLRGFARNLAQARLSELANGPNALGRMTIPLNKTFEVRIPARTIPVPLPGTDVDLQTPAFRLALTTTVNTIVFLPDGIHVFGAARI